MGNCARIVPAGFPITVIRTKPAPCRSRITSAAICGNARRFCCPVKPLTERSGFLGCDFDLNASLVRCCPHRDEERQGAALGQLAVNPREPRGQETESRVAAIMSGRLPLLPPYWIAIAERPRESAAHSMMLVWHGLPGAPFSILEARRLAAKGAIIMANRHFPDRVELLVRPARNIIIGRKVP
jgi:hypothetical protein